MTQARMNDPEAIANFLLAGSAIFTLKSTHSGSRYTYKVSKAKPKKEGEDTSMWFVGLLTGPDNDADYTYLGIICPDRKGDGMHARTTANSKMKPDSPPVKAINWFVRQVTNEGNRLDQVEFYHAGRCGRCGRTLTTPESVASGIGPVCASKRHPWD